MQKLLFLSFLILLSSCYSQRLSKYIESPETTIFLFRHAEKADSKNPPLTDWGQKRANDLANTLREAGITEIYSSDYIRTQQTVQPMANQWNLEIKSYNPRDLESFSSILKSSSGNIAVSGHSNTTPELVKLLGGNPGLPIGEKWEFDRLYILTLKEGKVLNSVQLKYGAFCKPIND
jgi:phosphohistidine phosphatase SixA